MQEVYVVKQKTKIACYFEGILTSGSTISKSLEGVGSDANPALNCSFSSSYEETIWNNKQLTCKDLWHSAAIVEYIQLYKGPGMHQ